jgi:hypothetical protein
MATKAASNKFNYCDICANTGILSASLFKNSETNVNEKIVVKPCGRHFKSDLINKNIYAMTKASGLKVDVVVESDNKDK